MHRTFFSLVVFASGVVFYMTTAISAGAGESPDPTKQFRPFAEKLVSILTDPNLHGDEKSKLRREKVMKAASERFDFHEMSKRTLGREWRKLSKDEQNNFVGLFTSLLEHAYISQIEGYSKQKIVFKKQRIKGKRAQVVTAIVDNDSVVSVSYIMMLKGNTWMVYDIVVEGVSLVRNYMEQFKEILRKEGYAALVKQVENKVAELENNKG